MCAAFNHSLRLLVQHLPDTARHDDPPLRGDLVLAGVMCGQGTDHTSAGITTTWRYTKGKDIAAACGQLALQGPLPPKQSKKLALLEIL